MIFQNKNNLCLRNLENQIPKNLHIKSISPFVIEQITPSLLVSKKQRDAEDKRDAYAISKSPQKSFVEYFRSPSNDRTKRYDARYRSRSNSRNKLLHQK